MHGAKHQAFHQALLLGSLVGLGQFMRTNKEVGRFFSYNSTGMESALRTQRLTQGNQGGKGDKDKDQGGVLWDTLTRPFEIVKF
jgi:hypothetical protein